MPKYYLLDENKNLVEGFDKEGFLALLEQAIEEGSLENIDENSAVASKIRSILNGTTHNIEFVTQAQYNQLVSDEELVPNTYYFITDDTTLEGFETALNNFANRLTSDEERITDLEQSIEDLEEGSLIVGKSKDVTESINGVALSDIFTDASNPIKAKKAQKADILDVTRLYGYTGQSAYTLNNGWYLIQTSDTSLQTPVNMCFTIQVVSGNATRSQLVRTPSGREYFVEVDANGVLHLYYSTSAEVTGMIYYYWQII